MAMAVLKHVASNFCKISANFCKFLQFSLHETQDIVGREIRHIKNYNLNVYVIGVCLVRGRPIGDDTSMACVMEYTHRPTYLGGL